MPNFVANPAIKAFSIAALARLCSRDWEHPFFGAVPYLHAMQSLGDIGDRYGDDSGKSVVAYFLSNATTWRGETARQVKAELNRRLKGA
ncbi:MAG TPA: hypothetical protein VFE77_03150 [Rhodanobacter sp.]|nr:hypothetical protein [Rhodanobacter sp.]